MNLRKAIAFVQIIFMVFLNVWNVGIVLADDSDIFGNNIAPNVMLLLDSSQSMDDDTGTLVAYASATTYTSVVYRGSIVDGSKVYKKVTSGSSGGLSCSSSNPCYTVYANTISAVNRLQSGLPYPRLDIGAEASVGPVSTFVTATILTTTSARVAMGSNRR